MMYTALISMGLLCGCAATSPLPDNYVGEPHRQEYLSIVIDGNSISCVPYTPVEGSPVTTMDGGRPDDMADAETVMCEFVQANDYAPCRIQDGDDEGDVDIWCAFAPGALWRMLPPGQTLPQALPEEPSI